MTLSVDTSAGSLPNNRKCSQRLPKYVNFVEDSFDETEEFDLDSEVSDSSSRHFNRLRLTSSSSTGSTSIGSGITGSYSTGNSSRMMSSIFRSTTPLLGRRGKLNSIKSCESTESSNSSGNISYESILVLQCKKI